MAHFGDLFIYLAAFSGLLSTLLYLAAWRGREGVIGMARGFFRIATISIVGALSTLLYLILTHDYSVAYVYSYSSSDLPLGFLISSLWGGQEGTFLLWVFYTGLLGLVMMRTAGAFERGNMVFLNLFIFSVLLILIKKSPFELMPVLRADGAGLNPLLQNYWMVIHPPIMFAGFSGAVFPFCFAMTALFERKYVAWSEAARRWTMFAWTALGVSLVMGGYWAYETLGWGGFWAWDPVENSSLIPWLFLTAQVHALFIKRHRRGLMRFSLVAVCMSFWAVLYGTFLTRSGVLADFSVHSFVDLGINQFLIGGLFFFVLLGGSTLVYRWRDIDTKPSFSSVNSRAYLVSLGIVIIFLGGVLVLLGTSAPLLTRVTENPSNVGLPYYFATMTPIAIVILLLIAAFPAFRWNRGLARKRLLWTGITAGLVTAGLLLAFGVTSRVVYVFLFGAAASAFVPNAYVFFRSWRERKIKPGYLSHVGLAIALTGAAASAGFEKRETVALPQNVTVAAMGYDITFTAVTDTPKGFDCHVDLKKDNGTMIHAVLPHEFPKNAEGVMKRPYVENYLDADIYISPNSFQPADASGEGEMTLLKGETRQIGKYQVTFYDFEISDHGEASMSAAARLNIAFDGHSEDVAPSLRATDSSVVPVSDQFDSGAGAVSIAGVIPEQGGVVLKFSGDFVPVSRTSPAVLVIELDRKPLINLFWLGTIIIFLGGILSMRRQRRKRRETASAGESSEPQPASNVPV